MPSHRTQTLTTYTVWVTTPYSRALTTFHCQDKAETMLNGLVERHSHCSFKIIVA